MDDIHENGHYGTLWLNSYKNVANARSVCRSAWIKCLALEVKLNASRDIKLSIKKHFLARGTRNKPRKVPRNNEK